MSRVSRTRPWGVVVLAACICLSVFVCAGPAFAGEPALPQSGLPLTPSVLPVIVLQGSDYDMGYQYAQQTTTLFGESILKGFQHPGAFTDPQMLTLKAYQWYIQRDTPEYIDQFKGIAAAATDAGVPLSYVEVLAHYVGTRPSNGTPPDTSGVTLPPNCSAWAAWGRTTVGGKLLTGQEMDPPWGSFGSNSYVAVVAYPTTGNAYINVTQPGFLTSIPVMPGINNKGVSTTGNLGGAWRDGDWAGRGWGIKAGLTAHVLRFANSAAQAKQMWLDFKPSGVWNITIADVKGNAFTVESTALFQQVRKPGDNGEVDFITSRNSFFTHGKASLNGQPGKFYPHGGWALDPVMSEPPDSQSDMQMASVRTNQTMYNMFTEYKGHVDLAFAKMLFRHYGKIPSDPWDEQAIRANKAKYYGNPGNLSAGFETIGQPDNGDGGVMNICTGSAARVGLPYDAGPTDDVYWVAATHTFYKVALAADPDAMVSQAQAVAQRDIGVAYQKLMWKSYGDVGFDALNSLFSQANREWQEGTNWMTKADAASGNGKMLALSNAASWFANAQAHAQQVYEGLVRPAVQPTQLGLRPYIPYEYGF